MKSERFSTFIHPQLKKQNFRIFQLFGVITRTFSGHRKKYAPKHYLIEE